MEEYVNDGAADRRRPETPPTRSDEGQAEGDDNHAAGGPPPASERPSSVREAMQRSRKYNPRPAPPAPSRRRKPTPPAGGVPAPARELTDGPAAEIPSREVEVGNQVWSVLLKGSSTVGAGNTPGARLLSVGLEAPGDRANPEGTHYLVAPDLDDVDESVLRELVTRAMGNPDAPRASARPAGKPRGRGRFRRRNR